MDTEQPGLELVLPDSDPRRPLSDAETEEWLDATEVAIARGAWSPWRLARVLGVPLVLARRWMGRVYARWASGLTKVQVETRREQLWREAGEVAATAWAGAAATKSERARVDFLRVVLMSVDRRAKLCGLESVQVDVRHQAQIAVGVDIVARVEEQFALPPGSLAVLGRSTAQLLSVQAAQEAGVEAGEVVEVEVVAPTPSLRRKQEAKGPWGGPQAAAKAKARAEMRTKAVAEVRAAARARRAKAAVPQKQLDFARPDD